MSRRKVLTHPDCRHPYSSRPPSPPRSPPHCCMAHLDGGAEAAACLQVSAVSWNGGGQLQVATHVPGLKVFL